LVTGDTHAEKYIWVSTQGFRTQAEVYFGMAAGNLDQLVGCLYMGSRSFRQCLGLHEVCTLQPMRGKQRWQRHSQQAVTCSCL